MGELNDQKRRERRRIIRDMTVEQAQHELADLRMNLFNLRMQAAGNDVKNTRQFSQTRKDIAAVLHKLRMIQLEELYGEAVDEVAVDETEQPEEEAVETAEPETADEEEEDEKEAEV